MKLRTSRRGQWSGMSRRANMVTAPFWPYYADGASIGNRSNGADWEENSDMAMARLAANSGHIWFVSDAGASGNRIMAQRISDAADRGTWVLEQALDAAPDFEALASATLNGQAYLYIADIGDNSDNRATINIYRCKEPTITGSDDTLLDVNTEKIVCAYPGGNPPTHNDAETLLVDPDTGDMYIISKRDAAAGCYRLLHADSYTGTQTLTFMGAIWTPASITANATGSNSGYYTGGAINDNGDLIALRNYTHIYMFRRKPRQPIYHALLATGVSVPAFNQPIWRVTMATPHCDEPHGEGVCFDSSDNIYTCSEYLSANGHGAANYPTFKFNRVQRVVNETSFQDGVAPTAGYAGTRDCYIYRNNGGAEESTEFGVTATQIIVDYDSANVQRIGFLLWDISTIPTTATVVGAEMILNIEVEGNYFHAYKIIGITWTESTTYAALGHLPLFDNAEVSSAAAVTCTGWVNLTGVARYKMPVATIQDWVTTPANNKGLLLWGGVTDGNGQRFTSSEGTTATLRPKLVVRWW